MRVRFLQPVDIHDAGRPIRFEAGRAYEISTVLAESFVGRGLAVADTEAEPAPEHAALEPAAGKRRRRRADETGADLLGQEA